MNLRMSFKELFDLPGLVGREVVGDDVDLFATRLIDDNVGEEGDELGGSVARSRLAQDLPALGIERRVERERAMPEVLKTVPLSPTRGERQDRIEPIQRLDRRFLIDAEHRGVLRRMQVKGDDVGGLLLKVRIVRDHVAIEPVGLEAGARHTRAIIM